VRLTASSILVALVVGGSFLTWAAREQHRAAVMQAERFAASVHEMTMAGLTGMMITGTVQQREVFLEQIEESHQVASVRVFRGDPVTRQYGPGLSSEMAADAAERRVLETGEPDIQVIRDERGERLRAVLPTPASEDYLGKNCLSCHSVEPGTVLGAVSVEISLEEVRASAAGFNRRSAMAALVLLVPFCLLIWYAISRAVTRPLNHLTDGLNRIAEGDIEAKHRLATRGSDEIGRSATAFNLVMDRAVDMLKSERIYRTVFEHSAFERTTGYSACEALGETPAILKSGRHDGAFYDVFWDKLLESGTWTGEIWNRRKDGSIYPESLSVVAVRDPSGETEHFIGMFSDITDRKLREEQMEFQALHDDLTGLPNRGAFMERLSQAVALAKRHDHPAPSVMYMDLDGFKWINDNLGHDAGDEVLKEFATRVARCVRESDTVARLGGDEFTVLLPETSDEEGVLRVAAKVLESMQEPMELAGHTLELGVSIGTATFPIQGDGPDELMRRADAAMYQSKQNGGGCAALSRWATTDMEDG
jgi:diguanylate cyclase (GGDEF)-like protein/PAS domain S-box-containing protein